MADSIDKIITERDRYADQLVAAYVAELANAQFRAGIAAMAKVHSRLTINLKTGTINRTPANLRVLRSMDTLLMDELDNAGLDRIIQAFADQWDSQVRYVQQLWRAMNDQMTPPLPDLKFAAKDKVAFVADQMSAVDQLRDNVVWQSSQSKATRC